MWIDAARGGDPGLLSFADGTVVDRGALLMTHSGTYDRSGMQVSFKPLILAANCIVGPRSVLMPGLSVAENQAVPAGELMMTAEL